MHLQATPPSARSLFDVFSRIQPDTAQMHHFHFLVLHNQFLHMQVPGYDEGIGILDSMHTVKSVWGKTECLLCANFRLNINIKFCVKLKQGMAAMELQWFLTLAHITRLEHLLPNSSVPHSSFCLPFDSNKDPEEQRYHSWFALACVFSPLKGNFLTYLPLLLIHASEQPGKLKLHSLIPSI